MDLDLSLTIELLEQNTDCLQFRLLLRNHAGVKLILPVPEIHGLRFCNKATMKESEWYTCLLISSDWAGITLEPGEKKTIDYRVRPCAIDRPAEDDFSDYYRWCVDLPNGEYLVWFRFDVGEDYFCPDSHYRFEDLVREAEEVQAVVWKGKAQSNRLHLVR
jgi:hypothetical protein